LAGDRRISDNSLQVSAEILLFAQNEIEP